MVRAVSFSSRGKLRLQARPEPLLRSIVRIGRRSDESLDQLDVVSALEALFGERVDSIELPGESRLLLVKMIELRVAARNRRGLASDLLADNALAATQIVPNLPPQRLQGRQLFFAVDRA